LCIHAEGMTLPEADPPSAHRRRLEPPLRQLSDLFDGARPDLAENYAFFKKLLAVLGELHRRGVPIVAGTDLAALGDLLHCEIELNVGNRVAPGGRRSCARG
jgi:hypothetical protein